MNSDTLGRLIRSGRMARGYSIRAAAFACAVPSAWLALAEEGFRLPKPERLLAVADALDLDLPDVLAAYLRGSPSCGALLRMGQLLLRRGRPELARSALAHAWYDNRQNYHGRYNGRLYLLLGVLAYDQKRYRQADQWFRRLQIHGLRRSGPDTQGIAHYNHGMVLAKLKRPGQALYQLEMAIQAFHRAGHRLWEGHARLASANILLGLHAYEEAELLYREAKGCLGEAPLAGEARLGEILARWTRIGPAGVLEDLRRAAELQSVGDLAARAFHALAVGLRQCGQPAQAAIILQNVFDATSDPELQASSWAEMAVCWALEGRAVATRAALGQFKHLEQWAPARDLLAMHLLARKLALPGPAVPAVPATTQGLDEGYEGRISCVLMNCG